MLRFEGDFALILLVALFLFSAFTPPLPPPVGGGLAMTLWAGAWLFAISGVRRGHGAAQLVAWFSLMILVLQAIATLMIAWH